MDFPTYQDLVSLVNQIRAFSLLSFIMLSVIAIVQIAKFVHWVQNRQ